MFAANYCKPDIPKVTFTSAGWFSSEYSMNINNAWLKELDIEVYSRHAPESHWWDVFSPEPPLKPENLKALLENNIANFNYFTTKEDPLKALRARVANYEYNRSFTLKSGGERQIGSKNKWMFKSGDPYVVIATDMHRAYSNSNRIVFFEGSVP
jgi:hypothetical protein